VALAILQPTVDSGDQRRFRADIGANRYYAYAIGRDTHRRGEGGRVLVDARHRSRLFGPLPETAHGRFELVVPAHLFDHEDRRIQLFSFRTRDRKGPSWSDVVSVIPASHTVAGPAAPDALPPLQLTQESAMTEEPTASVQSLSMDAENVALEYREAPLASAMFLGMIGNLLPSILPMAGNLLGGLFGGGKGGAKGSGGSPLAGLAELLKSDEVKKVLGSLLEQITSSKATAKGLRVSDPVLRQQLAVAQARATTPGGYAEAQVAPALLAALPALIPVLKQMVSPDTIKAINDGIGPNKLTGMVIDGMKDFAKLGIQSHEQDLKHLRALNPGVDDKSLDALLASLSLGVSMRDREPRYRRLSALTLDFADVKTEPIHGRTRSLYKLGGDLGFPLTLAIASRGDGSPTIRKASLLIEVMEPETRRVLAGRRFSLEKLSNGPLPVVPTLRQEKLRRLRPGEDYMVKATLVFERKAKSGRKERVGTSRSHLITTVGEAIFDRVEGSRGIVPLNDPERHRAFWHKLWQGTFDRKLRRVTWATRYTYTLDPERDKNGRLQTLSRVEDERTRHDVGKLKSGMSLSPTVLNRLLGTLDGQRMLTRGELDALEAGDFLERYQLAARGQVEIDADPGRSGALWLWPEVKLLEVVLRVAGAPDEHGRVASMDERTVIFPMPAMVHLVAVRTGESDGEEGLIGGMQVVSDKKVALYSTQLVKAPGQEQTGRRTDERETGSKVA
jgi:hypothetical protein